MDAAAVRVEGLRFSYGQAEVLHGLTFQLAPGEVLGLLGVNGAGKSTTLKILAGILSPGSGIIRIQGFTLPRDRDEAKRILGYVPESAGLYESLSANGFYSAVMCPPPSLQEL
jgi:ABC-2 type transport system ATP-binding protein